jgi:hypothetical protein
MHKFEVEFLSAKLKASGTFGIVGAVAALVILAAIVWLMPGIAA